MDTNYFISIGRQLGSGGRQIGAKLAATMGIAFYDKELIQIASKESGLGKNFFEQADEKTSHSVFSGISGIHGTMLNDMYSNFYLSNETLFKIQSDVIRELASQGSSLFVGRCADYVLAENPRCLNVFITADLNDRVKRVIETHNIAENKARDFIEKMDKKRAAYYNYYSNKSWGIAESYHLCVNSSVLGVDETVSFLHDFAKKKFGF